MKKLLIATTLSVTTLPAYAAVVYNFTSAPFGVGVINGNEATDTPGARLPLNVSPYNIGDTRGASLSFANPLSANSTTRISAENGGYDLIGTSNSGGLESYSASSDRGIPITSDISEYTSGSIPNIIILTRYSSVEGEVTTDANGKISAWNLLFSLYDNPGGGYELDTSANTLTGSGFNVDAQLYISSSAPRPETLYLIALNEASTSTPYTFNSADTSFADPGGAQIRYYSSQPGSWTSPVPVPAAVWLFGSALAGFIGFNRRKQGSSLAG